MESVLIGVHVLAAIVITGLVLMQQGKGADAGASFGGGGSQTVFGSSGSGNFLTRTTTWMVIVFFATSIGLAIVAKQRSELGVGQSSLVSGDLEQITAEQERQRDEAEAALNNELSIDTALDSTLDGLPSLDADISEIPVVADEAIQEQLEEIQTEVNETVDELEDSLSDQL